LEPALVPETSRHVRFAPPRIVPIASHRLAASLHRRRIMFATRAAHSPPTTPDASALCRTGARRFAPTQPRIAPDLPGHTHPGYIADLLQPSPASPRISPVTRTLGTLAHVVGARRFAQDVRSLPQEMQASS
jgi:hypothetical protein